MNRFRTQLLALSAPSGAGKTTIARALTKRYKDFTISVSATTRPKRPSEKEGRDYHFLTMAEFKKNIRLKNFLEYEEVHGDLYGTMKSTVKDLLDKGHVVIFDIDVNGALSIKRLYPEAVLVFIKPPSLEELRKRLKNRKSESEEAIARRLKRIDFEYAQAEKFDYTIVNDHLEHAVQQIEKLILLK